MSASLPSPAATAVMLRAAQLGFAHPGAVPLLQGLNFTLRPGLNLVRGGDGRGKTTLLRLIAGELAPTKGRVQRPDLPVSHEHPEDAAHDPVVASDWLAARRAHFGALWQADLAEALIPDLSLAEHLHKPLYMLSTGSRRKVGLVAAAASGATLTLLETPLAALDARASRRVLALLFDAAAQTDRIWVLADYLLPPSLADLPLAAVVDLGD